ncbi:hypothetical protein L210DRAFT_506173 [Boletus edulis BED1]|uniref:Uncharacterized protein n=1 Tax=Boletus edulis BED1 TaxID=1328754 RepID=A0AAD4G4E5_BOLED|nr:hypothetical protein L210DRAFT_506173 [Boletus edulis BED1]
MTMRSPRRSSHELRGRIIEVINQLNIPIALHVMYPGSTANHVGLLYSHCTLTLIVLCLPLVGTDFLFHLDSTCNRSCYAFRLARYLTFMSVDKFLFMLNLSSSMVHQRTPRMRIRTTRLIISP